MNIDNEQEQQETEENWDFDFSEYGEEEKEELNETIDDSSRPVVSGLRSRFSNGEAELNRLAEMNLKISTYSIKVAARTQDINILWTYYGMLDEFWESIRNIYGSHINEEVDAIKHKCIKLLEETSDGNKIEHKVHNNLLYFRSVLYKIKQRANLSFEVEKTHRGIHGKAERGIQQ